MTNEIFMQILGGLFTVIVGLITAYVIPLLKAQVSAEEMSKLTSYIQILVKCANQIFTPEQWNEKKEYVMKAVTKFINEKLHLTLEDEEISNMIEGYVNEEKAKKSE